MAIAFVREQETAGDLNAAQVTLNIESSGANFCSAGKR